MIVSDVIENVFSDIKEKVTKIAKKQNKTKQKQKAFKKQNKTKKQNVSQ